MNTISIDRKNVSMIAHRGVSGIEMENTCAAFVAAGNRSYFGIETDVHVTKDGKIAVIHDDNLNRVAGVDLIVEETTLEELQSIPLYNKVSGTFRTDLRIPVLADYISICKRYEKKAILELKNRMNPDAIAEMVSIIKNLDYLEHVVFISFSWENLADIRKLVPEQTVQFLTTDYDDALIQKLIDNRFDLDIRYPAVTKELVDVLHENGLKINCWTADDPAEAAKLIEMGVDYITSNILE